MKSWAPSDWQMFASIHLVDMTWVTRGAGQNGEGAMDGSRGGATVEKELQQLNLCLSHCFQQLGFVFDFLLCIRFCVFYDFELKLTYSNFHDWKDKHTLIWSLNINLKFKLY